jgi:hypothetical protein
MIQPPLSRRHLLKSTSLGFGYLALQALLADEVHSERLAASVAPTDGPLAPKPTHFPARAKRVIFLFMKGGPSGIDTFDFKPKLQQSDGQPLPFDKPRVQFAPTGNLLKSPWTFRRYGESGQYVSDLFPHVARCVDDLCILKSVYGTNPAHGGACLKLHTGSDSFVRPSFGSWVTYGLGSENQNLPGFLTICPTLAHGGVKNWGSAFLPAAYAGTPLGNASASSELAQVEFMHNIHLANAEQRRQLDLVRAMNDDHLQRTGALRELEARTEAMELAFRMQTDMPEAMDLQQESTATHQLYGLDQPETADFGRQCLMARRFAEAGVRFVQVTHSNTQVQWDQHADLFNGHTMNAREVDLPIAGLLRDLKARGMLDETLVLWGGEFGRTPTAEGSGKGAGRDHNPEGFVMWMAGGGVRAGTSYGETDEFGYYAAVDRLHVHDLHATVLHLLGLDHLRLTFRYAGRDFRLTDVAGEVAQGIIDT